MLLPDVQSLAFSDSVKELVLYSPSMLHEAATTFLTPPPPSSLETKFWSVMHGMASRKEGSDLVFGPRGIGASDNEAVLEVIERSSREGRSSFKGSRQNLQRSLEAWIGDGPAEFTRLNCLRRFETNRLSAEVAITPIVCGLISHYYSATLRPRRLSVYCLSKSC